MGIDGKVVLVTGGAGFVGSSLAIQLKTRHPDLRVVSLDNLKRRGSELALPRLREAGVEFVHGDVRHYEDIASVGPVDWLLECSAEPSVHAGYNAGPHYALETNLGGALQCLEHLRRHGGRMVFFSSSRIYPIDGLRDLPFTICPERGYHLGSGVRGVGFSDAGIAEDLPLPGARSLYGSTKLSAELFIAEYAQMYGVESVINRCGVLAGPWQMGKVDQGFVTLWVSRHVFGGPLSYMGFGGHGLQTRDILHVQDLYELVELQMQQFDTRAHQTFNVGGGVQNEVCLKQVTERCRRLTGTTLSIGPRPETHPADVPYYTTDNARVTAALGWVPKRGIDVVLEDIHTWIHQNIDLLRPVLEAKAA